MIIKSRIFPESLPFVSIAFLCYDRNGTIQKKARRLYPMEIERKFVIPALPENLDQYPCDQIVQAYICRSPVIRIRRKNDQFILTVKGEGMLAREETELPLPEESYQSLLTKTEGSTIRKRRYRIPEQNGLTIELDVFEGDYDGLIMAEVEFPDLESADKYLPPSWFGREVTTDPRYFNSSLSENQPDLIPEISSHKFKK